MEQEGGLRRRRSDRAAGELTKAQVSGRCVGDQTTAGGHTGA